MKEHASGLQDSKEVLFGYLLVLDKAQETKMQQVGVQCGLGGLERACWMAYRHRVIPKTHRLRPAVTGPRKSSTPLPRSIGPCATRLTDGLATTSTPLTAGCSPVPSLTTSYAEKAPPNCIKSPHQRKHRENSRGADNAGDLNTLWKLKTRFSKSSNNVRMAADNKRSKASMIHTK